MAINFNHTIVWARDSEASATFLAQILGRRRDRPTAQCFPRLPAPKRWGPFQVVKTDNATNLDFMNASETEFDEIFGRVRERSLPYWADHIHKRKRVRSIITT
jgi:hypothetical protein